MAEDLLVIGLDLATGQEVHAGDRSVPAWRRKGHNGDQSLVCRQCYEGVDLPGGPRVVPLVPRGRVGGVRRAHFAHPAGMAPPGGRHNPESSWHSLAKHALARWARWQGTQARVEAYTPDGGAAMCRSHCPGARGSRWRCSTARSPTPSGWPAMRTTPTRASPMSGCELQARPTGVHQALRYDAQPPWTDQATWRYLCDTCDTTFTGSQLRSNPLRHRIDGLGIVGGQTPPRPRTPTSQPTRRPRPAAFQRW